VGLEAELMLNDRTRGSPHGASMGLGGIDADNRGFQRRSVASSEEHTVFAILDQFRNATNVGRDDWQAVRHRLKYGHRHPFRMRWKDKDVRQTELGRPRLAGDPAAEANRLAQRRSGKTAIERVDLAVAADDQFKLVTEVEKSLDDVQQFENTLSIADQSEKQQA